MSDNPLSEADPKSLDVLFAMDPSLMEKQDIATIVAELRRMREQWAANEAKAAASGGKPKATAKKAPQTQSAAGMDLDDLASLLGI